MNNVLVLKLKNASTSLESILEPLKTLLKDKDELSILKSESFDIQTDDACLQSLKAELDTFIKLNVKSANANLVLHELTKIQSNSDLDSFGFNTTFGLKDFNDLERKKPDAQLRLEKLNTLIGIAEDSVRAVEPNAKIKVAVLDTGISPHELLNEVENKTESRDFNPPQQINPIDVGNHGTSIAGIIAAKGNTRKGIKGICQNIDLVDIKVASDADHFDILSIMQGLLYAMSIGVKVVNISWTHGFNLNDKATVDKIYLEKAQLLEKIIECAASKSIFIVFAAGNLTKDVSGFLPSNTADYITVGSIDMDGNRSAFSNFGQDITIYAPGESNYTILVASPNGYGFTDSGTSYAAPYVVGLIALMLQFKPDLSLNEAKKLMIDNGHVLKNDPLSKFINIAATLNALKNNNNKTFLNQKKSKNSMAKVRKMKVKTLEGLIKENLSNAPNYNTIFQILTLLGISPGNCNAKERVFNPSTGTWDCPGKQRLSLKNKLLLPATGASIKILDDNGTVLAHNESILANRILVSPKPSTLKPKSIEVTIETPINGVVTSEKLQLPWV